VFLPRLGQAHLGVKDFFAITATFGKSVPPGIGDLAAAQEFCPALFADTIYCDNMDLVLEGTGIDHIPCNVSSPIWPVGGQSQDICPLQRHYPGALREITVVADVDTNVAYRRFIYPERFIAAVNKAVNAQERQVVLSVLPQQSVRPHQYGGIVTPVSVQLEQTDNEVNTCLSAAVRQFVCAGTGNRFHRPQCFFSTGEHVAG